MQPEEELAVLRLENQELRIKIRKHRVIGEQAESDLRELRHHVEKACSYAAPLLSRDDPACVRCLARLAKIVELLRSPPESDSPPS
jgi:hypothetical protein